MSDINKNPGIYATLSTPNAGLSVPQLQKKDHMTSQVSKTILRKDAPELSVVILGYREEDRLPAFVDRVESELQTLGISYELVLVANYWPGKGDRTPEITAQLAQKNARLKFIAKPKEGRMGWDLRSGLELSSGNVVAVIDGDGQFHPNDIVKVYQELRRRHLDLCQTYRIDRQDGWQRRVISQIYNLLFKMIFPGIHLRDINSKPKLLTRQTYDSMQLTSSDWFIDAEIIIQASREGRRMGEIPVGFVKKEARSYVTKATILEFIRNLVVFRIRETLYQFNKWWNSR